MPLKLVYDYKDHESEEDSIEILNGSATIYTITNPGKLGWAKEHGLKSGVSTVVVDRGATILVDQ